MYISMIFIIRVIFSVLRYYSS